MTRRVLAATITAMVVGTVAMPVRHAVAADGPWLVGVGVVDITPPRFDRKADAKAFPLCAATTFSGRRRFGLQEPYVDARGDGRYHEGDPYCDANHNGRYDGLYNSGGIDVMLQSIHDHIDVRAVAVSDGRNPASKAVVIESVVSQGLFEGYSRRIRASARGLRPGIGDVVVSSNHNESSPDPIGIYGGPDVAGAVGARSGVDDYYLDFLVKGAARAAAAAFDNRRPATLSAGQFPVPSDVYVRLSDNFPTTGPNATPVALDPKLGVLVARDLAGAPILTLMSLAAHNQEIGHSRSSLESTSISADWPGAFGREIARLAPGSMGMFLVADNGSIEDPRTVVPVTSTRKACPDGCFEQAEKTGAALAAAVISDAAATTPLTPGPVRSRRDSFFVPLENNLFKAAVVAGIFAGRHAFLAGQELPSGVYGPDLRTSVAVVDVGPDLQLLANPGEAFPALMLGSPWTINDASCPGRPNPPAPTWHGRARWRFQVGLADDMLGYLLPPWALATQPGIYTTTCTTDSNDRDTRGHQHKLETESAGPIAGQRVAEHLAALLAADPDTCASYRVGRFLLPDGSTSVSAVGAVGVRLRGPGGGDRAGVQFIDFDGQPQSGPDLTTRGFIAGGCRTYVDVYPDQK